MNTIDSYNFGQIVINSQKYTSDLIIFPERVQGNWRRVEGHELNLKDITGIMDENPEILLVGTGAFGFVRVLPEVEQATEARNIQLIVQPTGEAWLAFAYLVIFGSVFAFTSYMAALRLLPYRVVATYTYVNPVIAVFLGWLILREAITGYTMAGAVLVVAGVAGIFANR